MEVVIASSQGKNGMDKFSTIIQKKIYGSIWGA